MSILLVAQPAAIDAFILSTGRLVGTVAALVAVAGAVVGWRALKRSRRVPNGRKGAITAVVAGLVGMATGALVVAAADSGPGSGQGVVGGYAGLVIGLIAAVLGVVARSRVSAAGTAR